MTDNALLPILPVEPKIEIIFILNNHFWQNNIAIN